MPLFCQEDTVAQKPLLRDRIYLVNGSFLEGRLKKMERGQITFKADKLTTFTIDKKNVATLLTPSHPMRVDMIDGKVYFGTLEALPNNGTAFIRTGETDSTNAGGRALNLLEIESIRLNDPNFFQNVQGEVNLGLSYNRSSDIFRTNISNTLDYTRHLISFKQTSNGINTLNDSTAAWERFDASIGAGYKMKNKWRSAVNLSYQRMIELGISSRVMGTTVMGYPMVNTRKFNLTTFAGVSLSREFRTDQTSSNIQTEIPFILSLQVFKMSNNDFTATSSTTVYKGLTVSDRIRLDHSTTLSLDIYKDLKISLEFFFNLYSKRSTANVSKADYGTVFGLGYKF